MKKILLSLAGVAMTLSSFASTRILYQQNFETAADVASTGWTYGSLSSIASDDFGKFLELNQNGANGRTGKVTWGQDIYMKDGASVLEDGIYTVKYDFCIAKGSNNQYNGAFTVFTNHAPVDNQPYRCPWSPAGWWESYLFDMSQVDKSPLEYVVNGPLVTTNNEDGTTTNKIDFTGAKTLTEGTWYTVTITTNVNTREVEYTVIDASGDMLAGGVRTVPATNPDGSDISMYAEGLHVMLARYVTIARLDNIVVSCESAQDYVNAPTVALTRVGKTADEVENLAMRAYTINFLEGETLHVVGTDGVESVVEYADCDGAYVYETTTSGTLKAWTTGGSAVSEVIETAVDCSPIVLPAVNVTISAVSAGFGKTYTLTVDNTEVPLRPTMFINYEFVGESGAKIAKEGEASGTKLTVTEKGTLTVTSAAFGYQSTTTSAANDLQFEVKKTYDFARMTEADLTAAGFPAFETLNTGNMSGFNSWTGRKRLYYQLAGSEHDNGEGVMVLDNVYPFGFIADDNTTNVLKYANIVNEGKENDVDGNGYFEGITIFPKTGRGNKNVGILYHVGIYNNQTNDNYNNITVHGLDQNDFVVFNYINSYGGNSNHPVCANDEEYFAQLKGDDAVYSVAKDGVLNEADGTYDVTYALYRVDTACTKITVFKKAGDSALENIFNDAPVKDNGYYSIDGIRWESPVRPGLYIHNGKKVIIK